MLSTRRAAPSFPLHGRQGRSYKIDISRVRASTANAWFFLSTLLWNVHSSPQLGLLLRINASNDPEHFLRRPLSSLYHQLPWANVC